MSQPIDSKHPGKEMTAYERYDISLRPKDVTDRRVRLAVTDALWHDLGCFVEKANISVTQPTDSLHMIQSGLKDTASASTKRELAFAAWDILTIIRMEHSISADKPVKVVFVPEVRMVRIHIDSGLPIYAVLWK